MSKWHFIFHWGMSAAPAASPMHSWPTCEDLKNIGNTMKTNQTTTGGNQNMLKTFKHVRIQTGNMKFEPIRWKHKGTKKRCAAQFSPRGIHRCFKRTVLVNFEKHIFEILILCHVVCTMYYVPRGTIGPWGIMAHHGGPWGTMRYHGVTGVLWGTEGYFGVV